MQVSNCFCEPYHKLSMSMWRMLNYELPKVYAETAAVSVPSAGIHPDIFCPQTSRKLHVRVACSGRASHR